MNKRETRKEAYRRIVKENQDHQSVYDDLKQSSTLNAQLLANMVGLIPSQEKRNKYKALVIVYIVLMGLTLLLRCLGLIALMDGLNPAVLAVILALGVVVPGVAIYGAATSRSEIYYSTSGLLLFGIFRGLTKEAALLEDPINLLGLLPMVLAIVLGFILPSLLKTKHSTKLRETTVNGEKISVQGIVFEDDERYSNTGLLDS